MKRKDFKSLVLMGVASSLLVSAQAMADTTDSSGSSTESSDPNDGNLGYHLMTEEELFLELTPEAMAQYKALPPEGKKLAREVASMRCASSNLCKGLNACKGPKNDCAGKGECKGTGKCGLSDKSLAIKLVTDKLAKEKMSQKRNSAMNQR